MVHRPSCLRVVGRGAAARLFALLVCLAVPSAASAGPTGSIITLEGDASWRVEAGGVAQVRVTVVNEGLSAADVKVGLAWLGAEAPPGVAVEPELRQMRLGARQAEEATFRIHVDPDAAGGTFPARVVAQWDDAGTTREAGLPTRLVIRGAAPAPAAAEPAAPGDPLAPLSWLVPAAMGGVAGACAGAALALLVDALRRGRSGRAWGLLLAPLYSRIRPSEVLDQEVRRRIVDAIRAQPGIRFAELRRRTGLANGTLYHHLRKLVASGVVTSERRGARRTFALAGEVAEAPAAVTPAERRLLALLEEDRLTVAELAARLGVSRQGAAYHVRNLEAKGLVAKQRDAGLWRYARRQAEGGA